MQGFLKVCFLSFRDLDYTQPRNREKLIEMFVRKVVLFDDKDEPTIYYNGFESNQGIKENAETETEFGFDALVCEHRKVG